MKRAEMGKLIKREVRRDSKEEKEKKKIRE